MRVLSSQHFVTAIGAAGLACICAGPAWAASPVTFVSAAGADAGACATTATACRTFGYAIGQTAAGGEIKALTPGNFGPFTINKSLTVTGVEGASVLQAANGADAIAIAAGANDVVSLIGLAVDGGSTGGNGVKLTSGGLLTIKNCMVRNFKASGIAFLPSGGTKFLIEDTILTNFGWEGVSVMAAPGANASGALNRISVTGAKWAGVEVNWTNRVSISDSLAADNEIGFAAGGNSKLELSHSTVTQNQFGVVNWNVTIESGGNNFIRGNVTNVQGSLTQASLQ
jgi:hypothetical protein